MPQLVESLPISSDARCASCSRRVVRTSDLAFLCMPLISVGQVSACCRIRAARGAVTFCDVATVLVGRLCCGIGDAKATKAH